MGKGSIVERELINRLEDEYDYRTMRAPGSGGGTDRDRPDCIAGQDKRLIVFEAKSSSGDPIYVGKDEVRALIRYAADFGAEAYVAVRWKSVEIQDRTFYCANPHDMHDAGKSYRAKRADCLDKPHWTALDDLV